MPEIRRFNWVKLTPEQREQATEMVRSLGLNPDHIAVDFTLVRYGPGPWQLHLTEYLRNANGVKFVGADGDLASRVVVRQIDPPAFLLTTSTEETPVKLARALLSRIRDAFKRPQPRVKVEITCPHGEFIPGAYTPTFGSTGRYGCPDCGMKMRLSTFDGEVTW